MGPYELLHSTRGVKLRVGFARTFRSDRPASVAASSLATAAARGEHVTCLAQRPLPEPRPNADSSRFDWGVRAAGQSHAPPTARYADNRLVILLGLGNIVQAWL